MAILWEEIKLCFSIASGVLHQVQHSDKDGFCFRVVLKYQSEAYKISLEISAQGSSGILDVEAVASIIRCLQICELGQK